MTKLDDPTGATTTRRVEAEPRPAVPDGGGDGNANAAKGDASRTNDAAPAPASAGPADGQPKLEIPERPQLASNVELRGEMTESAFKNPPWLIERDGKYVQVSRLLYVVAEHLDGRRTLDDVAADVSDAVKRKVTVNDVRLMVANLMLIGVVLQADGSPVDTSALQGPSGPSPLTLNMRMKMLSPRFIEPATRVFQFLFWPPVVLIVLAAVAAVEYWLYFIHGVGGSLHQALYQPTLLVNILGVIVLAAAFHEFGHAAALSYGGGRVKGMGAGLYMVYPAFYTDVTDAYRLPRWSRVRTDLGGFYFNVIFTLVVMGLWVATGWEFLLLIVVLINLEIVHQLLPFVRLDGYWTLADITGIPDFFSQIGPFLRSVLPSWVPLPKGRKLPELKTWAKLFFAGYILVTVPLLLFLLFVMVRAIPRVIATLLDSLRNQATALSQALSAGDTATAGAAAVQALILFLPALGLAYTLYTVARRLIVGTWHWSSKSTARRGIAAGGAVAAVALLAFLWTPQILIPGAPPAGAAGNPLTGIIQFEPIRPGEALTIQEAAAATAPPFDPSASPANGTTPDGAPAPAGTAAPAPTQAPEPTPAAGGGSTPAPAPGGGSTPAPSPPAATPQPGGGEPAPTATPAQGESAAP